MSECSNERRFEISKETKNMYNLFLILGILFSGFTFSKAMPSAMDSADPWIFLAFIPGTFMLIICVYNLINIHILKPYIAIDHEAMTYFTGMKKVIIPIGDIESVKLKKYNKTKTVKEFKMIIKLTGKFKKIKIRHREFENADQIESLLRSNIDDETVFK